MIGSRALILTANSTSIGHMEATHALVAPSACSRCRWKDASWEQRCFVRDHDFSSADIMIPMAAQVRRPRDGPARERSASTRYSYNFGAKGTKTRTGSGM